MPAHGFLDLRDLGARDRLLLCLPLDPRAIVDLCSANAKSSAMRAHFLLVSVCAPIHHGNFILFD
jgi:hypothetical protein